jgi:hypothetical protein
MELENITLHEVTKIQKEVLTDKWILTIKCRIFMIHSTDPKKLNKKEDQSKDESHLERVIK